MKIIPFSYEEHAERVNEWGERHHFPLPPPDLLPDIGMMVDDTAVGFLYSTNSKLGWIEWIFANPEKTPEERKEAIDTLLSALEKAAIIRGMKVLFSSSGSDAFKGVLERNGFAKTDENVTQYVKGVG
jgi:hypothetical protein